MASDVREAHLGALSWLSDGPLFVNAWWGAPVARELDAVCEAQMEAFAREGQLGVVTIIRPGFTPRLDEETRAASARLRKKLEHTFVCSGFLIDETGFLAAIVRSVLSGIHAITRAPYPTRVGGSTKDIAEFTARELASAGKPVDFARVVASLERIGLGAPAP